MKSRNDLLEAFLRIIEFGIDERQALKETGLTVRHILVADDSSPSFRARRSKARKAIAATKQENYRASIQPMPEPPTGWDTLNNSDSVDFDDLKQV